MKPEELLKRLRSGNTANVPFEDFCALVEAFGVSAAARHGEAIGHMLIPRFSGS